MDWSQGRLPAGQPTRHLSQPCRCLYACSKSQAMEHLASYRRASLRSALVHTGRRSCAKRGLPAHTLISLPPRCALPLLSYARQSAGAVDRTAGLGAFLLVDRPSPQRLPGSGNRTTAPKNPAVPKPAAKL